MAISFGIARTGNVPPTIQEWCVLTLGFTQLTLQDALEGPMWAAGLLMRLVLGPLHPICRDRHHMTIQRL